VERSQEEFNTISTVIKKELEQFEVTRVKEFKKIIVKYLESLLGHQQEVCRIRLIFARVSFRLAHVTIYIYSYLLYFHYPPRFSPCGRSRPESLQLDLNILSSMN